MKNVTILIALLLFSQATFAKKISSENTVQIKACSSYLLASKKLHADSAVDNYRKKASRECLALGYTEWETLERELSPGLVNVPVYCITGTIECQ